VTHRIPNRGRYSDSILCQSQTFDSRTIRKPVASLDRFIRKRVIKTKWPPKQDGRPFENRTFCFYNLKPDKCTSLDCLIKKRDIKNIFFMPKRSRLASGQYCRTGHLKTGPFDNRTQKVSENWPFEYRTVRYLVGQCIWMVFFGRYQAFEHWMTRKPDWTNRPTRELWLALCYSITGLEKEWFRAVWANCDKLDTICIWFSFGRPDTLFLKFENRTENQNFC
jgi:hypothetical protein